MMLKKVKISKKVGITIAVIGVLGIGSIAGGVKDIHFGKFVSGTKIIAATCQQFGGIMFNANALAQVAQFEYQFALAEFYSRHNEYEKGQEYFAKAAASAKASLGATSFLTFLAYHRKGESEQKHSKFVEAHEDFKAALEALPKQEEYDTIRYKAEYSLISTDASRTSKENIPFYTEHLALTEKLADESAKNGQLVYALWVLGKALDNGGQYEKSEPLWNKMINTARAESRPYEQFEPYLYDFGIHETNAGHYGQAERAFWEAVRIAAQFSDDNMSADALEAKADLRLRENKIDMAANELATALMLRQKLKDDLKLSHTYWGLSEVARRRDDLTKREDNLKIAADLTDAPVEKAQLLKSLAVIAALNNRTAKAKEYVEEWKKLVTTNKADRAFIFEKDLKNLLILYPQLNKPDKKYPSPDNTSEDFTKLQSQRVGPHRHGYYLTETQLHRLMDTICSSKPSETKK
jgi:hypothetical protein